MDCGLLAGGGVVVVGVVGAWLGFMPVGVPAMVGTPAVAPLPATAPARACSFVTGGSSPGPMQLAVHSPRRAAYANRRRVGALGVSESRIDVLGMRVWRGRVQGTSGPPLWAVRARRGDSRCGGAIESGGQWRAYWPLPFRSRGLAGAALINASVAFGRGIRAAVAFASA